MITPASVATTSTALSDDRAGRCPSRPPPATRPCRSSARRAAAAPSPPRSAKRSTPRVRIQRVLSIGFGAVVLDQHRRADQHDRGGERVADPRRGPPHDPALREHRQQQHHPRREQRERPRSRASRTPSAVSLGGSRSSAMLPRQIRLSANSNRWRLVRLAIGQQDRRDHPSPAAAPPWVSPTPRIIPPSRAFAGIACMM